MLNLFEQGKDINKEKINIKEAINYLADAWENVTKETIINCWIKTGILPTSSSEDINDATELQQEIIDEEMANIDQIIKELDVKTDSHAALLADAINEFLLNLDENIPTEEILSDEDIVKLIQEEASDENNDDSDEEPELVSFNDALKSLKTWMTFFEQQPLDEFNVEDMYMFKKYFNVVQRLELRSRKQTSITNFFNISEN